MILINSIIILVVLIDFANFCTTVYDTTEDKHLSSLKKKKILSP